MTPEETAAHDHGRVTVFVEKSWLIGIVAALIVQVFGGVWWAAVTSTKLANIEASITAMQTQLSLDNTDRALKASAAIRLEDRIARLEERDSDLSGAIKEINVHLSSIETYLNTHSKK